MVLVQGLVAAAAAALLISCGGGGGAPYANGGNGGTSGGNGGGSGGATSGISVRVVAGDTIETTAQETKYRQRFTVTVSNSNGLPVQGATISVKSKPVGYWKGEWSAGKTVPLDPIFCPTEDGNGDDFLNAGEDKNGNGRLDPPAATVVAKLENSATTDASGITYIVADWGKSDASWVAFALQVTATGASGATELVETTASGTGFVAGDESKPTSAFTRSPFGKLQDCTSTL